MIGGSAAGAATPRVVVIGLGPADAGLVSSAALAVIDAHPPEARWARTDRHPAVSVLGDHRCFDAVYLAAHDLDEVYATIAARLLELAAAHGSVCYAVPGSPLVAERSVGLLRSHAAGAGIDVVVQPALSFLDVAWARLCIDPLAAGVRLVDGHRFAVEAAGERGPLLVAQCETTDVLSDIKLAVDDPGPEAITVTVLQRLGLTDERIFDVVWDDLDREVEPDHLTSLWVPRLAAPVAHELVRFDELVRTLRERCPWDSVQTHASLRPYVVEEAYEVVDAIEQFDPEGGEGAEELCEELGDLLFQVVIHSTIAAEEGWFTLADVAAGVHDKLRHRHPHVFADVAVDGADDVVRSWDQIKAEEKGRTGPFDGIPATFPARLYAEKVLRRAAKAGLAVELDDVLAVLGRAEAAVRAEAERIVARYPGRAGDASS